MSGERDGGGGPGVLLVTTGGTISMLRSPEAGGAVPTLSGRELVERAPGLAREFDVEVEEFGRHPGPHMAPERMWELRELIEERRRREPRRGIVVTHGTDTMEETAYLLDRTLADGPPLVLTGAMRNASEASWDGPMNLMNAARTATSPRARDRGALVVLEGSIVQGGEAVKVETESGDAFRSPNWGPVGRVEKDEVLFFRRARREPPLETGGPAGPVDLVTMTSASDARLVDAALDSGALGLVVAGLGRGNVPPAVVGGLRRWVEADRPVVVTSRCLRGRVLQTYAYPGGGAQLEEMGVLFAEFLSGQQARMELALVLGRTRHPPAVADHFRGLGAGAAERAGRVERR